MTDAEEKALRILYADSGYGYTPREFARAMWPDSPGWQRRTKSGPYGSTKGGGMPMAAGGYLSRLMRKGWVKRSYTIYGAPLYRISAEGEKQLDAKERP